MREYVRTKHLREGDEVRETLYDEQMRVLLKSGNKLTGRGIDLISRLGYKGVYIENHEELRREDIPLSEPFLESETMLRMVAEMKKALVQVYAAHNRISVLTGIMEKYVEELVAIMQERSRLHDLIYEMQDMRIASNWIYYHSIATAILSAGIAITLGLPEQKIKDIALGGMLHDMGKLIWCNDLYQKENITEEERGRLREHPEQLFRLLQRETSLPLDTRYAVGQHHEKCDDSGYPSGIKQDKISLAAQIVALASAYDNMTNITPYNEPMTGAEAFEYLAGCGLYAVECVQALRSFACIYSVGTKVELSDGRSAVVLKNVPGIPERPYLLCGGKVLHLAKEQDLMALVIEREIL